MDVAVRPKPFQRPHLRPLNLNRKLPGLPGQAETAAQDPTAPQPPTPSVLDALIARVAVLEATAERKDVQLRQLQRQVEEARGQTTEVQRRLSQMQQQISRLEAQTRQQSGAMDFELLSKNAQQDCRFVFGKDALDLARIERNVDILNRVAADGPLVVRSDGPAAVARLQPALPVELHFHRNGVRVYDANDHHANGGLPPFLLYSSSLGQALVSDLLQGYLPAELQTSYPSGVQLKLIDRSHEVHATGLPTSKLQVAGNFTSAMRARRHSNPHSSTLEPLPEPGNDAADTTPARRTQPAEPSIGANPQPPVTSPKVADLPHSQRGIDPRPTKRPAYRPLKVSPATPLPASTPVLVHEELDFAPPGTAPVCRVKLRSRTHTLLIRALPSMTIGALQTAVAPTLGLDVEDFELCTMGHQALPPSSTLAAVGLVPNGTLFTQNNRR